MKKIMEIIAERNYSEETKKYILLFIDSFSGVYGKFISKEELVRRITKNLTSDINFIKNIDDMNIGLYNQATRQISIRKTEVDFEHIIIHEMIHCITNYSNEEQIVDGFDRTIEVFDNRGFISEGKGLNEGMVDYMTKQICDKYNYSFKSGYKRLNEIIKHLLPFTGESLIKEFLSENCDVRGILEDIGIEAETFISDVDMVEAKERARRTVFDEDNSKLENMVSAMRKIAMIYPRAQTVTELIRKYNFFKSLCKEFFDQNEFDIFSLLIEDIRDLKQKGVDLSEARFMTRDEAVKRAFKADSAITRIMSMSRDEVALNLEDLLYEDDDITNVLAPRIHEYLFYGEKCGKEISNRLYSLISVKNYLREHPEIDYRELSFAVYDYLNIFVAYDKDEKKVNIYDLGEDEILSETPEGLEDDTEMVKVYGSVVKDAEYKLYVAKSQRRHFEKDGMPQVLIEIAEKDCVRKQRNLDEMKEEIEESKERRMTNILQNKQATQSAELAEAKDVKATSASNELNAVNNTGYTGNNKSSDESKKEGQDR